MARILHTLATLILLALLQRSSSWPYETYVKDACNVTRYQDLCIRSLSPFSDEAQQDPSKWARAGVSVTITEAKNVSRFLIGLKSRNTTRRGRNRLAVSDCIECLLDSLDNLHQSLDVLRDLNVETFDSQMGDITTWVSAALTDEDTCLDGLEGPMGRQIKLVQERVTTVGHFTSNALALVSKLTTDGPVNSYGPKAWLARISPY